MRIGLLILGLWMSLSATAQIAVVNLLCNQAKQPLAVTSKQPQLSWQIDASRLYNVLQTAYQVIVADDEKLVQQGLGNIWDSKKVNASQNLHVAYAGKALLATKKYYWRVRVWDNQGHKSTWSHIAQWQMGLLRTADWQQAAWIAYEQMHDTLVTVPFEHGKGSGKLNNVKEVLPYFRKEVAIPKKIQWATAYVCGLGQFEIFINGKKVSDYFLTPTWSQYTTEAYYVPFDVKDYLQQGKNAIGFQLGNGMYYVPAKRYRKYTGAYGFPILKATIVIQYTDGTTQHIVTNNTWKTSESPISFSSIYGGEDYNANHEQEGWNTTAFDDATWKQAMEVKGVTNLLPQTANAVVLKDTFLVRKQTAWKKHHWVFDAAQNAAAIPYIQVKGNKGDTIRIYTGELLKEDGAVSQKATGGPTYFEYILKGNGIETWHPQFSYTGYRYMQIDHVAIDEATAIKERLPWLVQLSSIHMRVNNEVVSHFNCDNQLFHQTHQLINWAIKSNMQNLLTDCPHREKIGWLEQDYLMGNAIHYNFNIANYTAKILQDVATAQKSNGMLPEYAPAYVEMDFMNGIFKESPEWGSVAVILPWYMYQWYGNKQFLQAYYPIMQKYMHYLQSRTKDHILSFGLSDWYDLGPNKPGLCQLTPMGLTATATYYYNLHIMQQVANLLNKQQEANSFAVEAKQVKAAFNQRFFNKDSLYYGTNSQTANAMALYMNLVEPKHKQAVLDNLVNSIKNNDYKITAGDIGFRYLLQVLHKEGYSNIIYLMNNRSDVPGYGYQIAKGATALTESWQALPTVSNNHLMLGHLMEWLYAGLAGIHQEPHSIAYKNISIKPEVVGDITHAAASYESVYGTIASEWYKQGNEFKLEVLIPANTSATVYLPASKTATVLQDGKKVQPICKDGRTIVKVGSGKYVFVVK